MQDSLPLLSIHEGNPTLQPLIGRFLGSISERLHELRTAVSNSDLDSIKRISHKFRGSASTFGFPQLSASIRRVEDGYIQLASGLTQSSDVASSYNRLVNQCARLSTNGVLCAIDIDLLSLPKDGSLTMFKGASTGDTSSTSGTHR